LRPRICVSVKADDLEKVRKAIASSQRIGVSLVELRLDYASEEDYERIIGLVEKPGIEFIATIRPFYEGGAYRGSEKNRLRLFEKALKAPFKYVDVEQESRIRDSVIKLARARSVKVILSHHDWKGTPSLGILRGILSKMREKGADVCKIITTINDPVDEATLIFFIKKTRGVRLVCFGMGEGGFATRILSPLLGGFMTYASYNEPLAPGQATLKRMVSIYREMGIW